VRVTRGPQRAQALGDPVERSAGARVLRAFSPDRRAVPRGDGHARVVWLAEPATLLGSVTRRHQQHRERQAREAIMWGDPSGETGG